MNRTAAAVLGLVLAATAPALPAIARADDAWAPPGDGVLTEKHVQDYVSYLEQLKKAGGSQRETTRYRGSAEEKKALAAAGVSEAEVDWVEPRVTEVARALLLEKTPAGTWSKALFAARERAGAATRKAAAAAKNCPKDLLPRLQQTYQDSRDAATLAASAGARERAAKASIEAAEMAAGQAAPGSPERKSALERLDKAREAKNRAEDDAIEAARKSEVSKRARTDATDALYKAGADDAVTESSTADVANHEAAELAVMAKAAEMKPDLTVFPEKSLAVVRAKGDAIGKALAALGAPVFTAAAPK
jgi:hypothetical protein